MIGIVEGRGGGHLVEVGRRMEIVAVEEGHAKLFGEALADDDLARAGDAHEDDGERRRGGGPRHSAGVAEVRPRQAGFGADLGICYRM